MKTVVIGACAAGMGVAARLRRNLPNSEIVVYEKRDYVSFGACGLPYFVADQFSDVNAMVTRTVADFAQDQITVRTNCLVVGLDFIKRELTYKTPDGVLATDTYDELVITTGAQPYPLPEPWRNCENVFNLATKEDGLLLKQYLSTTAQVAVVGSGFIGLEVIETLSNRNQAATLIELGDRLGAKVFEPEVSEALQSYLQSQKVKIFLNNKVETLHQTGNKATELVLTDSTTIAADAVVFAVGVQPATQFLVGSGLKMAGNGAIIVDAGGRTNVANVWSCGDCATVPNFLTKQNSYVPLATTARKFAKIVADNIAGKQQTFLGTLETAIVKVLDFECARTGLTEAQAQAHNYACQTVVIRDHDRTNYVQNQRPLVLKMVMDHKTRTIIGAQIFGYHQAVLRIGTIISLIWNKAVVDHQLEQLDLPYSPPFARPVDIINIAISKLAKTLPSERSRDNED